MKKHIGKRLLPVLLAVCVMATPGFTLASTAASAQKAESAKAVTSSTASDPVFTAKTSMKNGTTTKQIELDLTLSKDSSSVTLPKNSYELVYLGWYRQSPEKLLRSGASLKQETEDVTFQPGETKQVVLTSNESFVYYENAQFATAVSNIPYKGGTAGMAFDITVSPDPSIFQMDTAKKYMYECNNANKGTVWYTFEAPKSGIVYLDNKRGDSERWFSLQLLNSSKKKVFEDKGMGAGIEFDFRHQFGITKGKTYYIRLEGTPSDVDFSTTGTVQLKYFKTIKEKSGTTKKKAVRIKKSKKVSGYKVVGTKTSDWYKFKNSKTGKIGIKLTSKYVEGSGRDKADFTTVIYNSKGKKVTGFKTKAKKYGKTGDGTVSTKYGTILTSKTKKLKKGTYYIKV
ncbi:MAG: hypothetical protein VB031_08990 [Eubacteriaceae bacterium]|nr:hypothetical protein [Eubacteriaceae bacterium]